ncbi:MAG: hypothetical protein LBM06_02925 [Prevotellaceae bacterium]|jgi:hypothetical protein|nr:hypothetical protein [Prevotellaceae bacterium]
MKPSKVLLLLLLSAVLLIACGDDDYYYPSVKLEFLTARSTAAGTLGTVITDEGETYPIIEDLSHTRTTPDSTLRIVSNYEVITTSEGTQGVKLYALAAALSPLPKPADAFQEGVKHDAAEVTSIWAGLHYLNILLDLKAQNRTHTIGFVQESVTDNEATRHRTVHLSLYHDNGGDVPAYSRRVYASVPLQPYYTENIRQLTVLFEYTTYEGEQKQYQVEIVP